MADPVADANALPHALPANLGGIAIVDALHRLVGLAVKADVGGIGEVMRKQMTTMAKMAMEDAAFIRVTCTTQNDVVEVHEVATVDENAVQQEVLRTNRPQNLLKYYAVIILTAKEADERQNLLLGVQVRNLEHKTNQLHLLRVRGGRALLQSGDLATLHEEFIKRSCFSGDMSEMASGAELHGLDTYAWQALNVNSSEFPNLEEAKAAVHLHAEKLLGADMPTDPAWQWRYYDDLLGAIYQKSRRSKTKVKTAMTSVPTTTTEIDTEGANYVVCAGIPDPNDASKVTIGGYAVCTVGVPTPKFLRKHPHCHHGIDSTQLFLVHFYEIRPDLRRKGYGKTFIHAVLRTVPGPFFVVLYPDQNTNAADFWAGCGLKRADGWVEDNPESHYLCKMFEKSDSDPDFGSDSESDFGSAENAAPPAVQPSAAEIDALLDQMRETRHG